MATVAAENVPTRRMHKAMSRLQAVGGVHEDSLDAVLNLVNPFPDYPAKRVGWPDSKAGSSVVMVDLYEQVISNPSGLAAGETWDLHACMLPFVFAGTSGEGGIAPFKKDPLSANNHGSLTIMTAKTGNLANPVVGLPLSSYIYGDLAQKAPFRVIAQGLELVNISADLYRGGSTFAYRSEAPVQYCCPWTSQAPSGALTQTAAFDVTLSPPTQPSDIVDWPNTYVGDGRDGLYVINTPTCRENEPKIFRGRDVLFMDDPNGYGEVGRYVAGSGGHNGWCLAGGFMSGLAQNSSILLKHRVFLEIFPSAKPSSDSFSLVRLSDKCTPYSPAIMEVLAQVLRDMPAGCPYTENPLGEWFQDILEHISAIAPTVGKVVGTIVPGVGALGEGIGAVSKHLSEKLKKKQSRVAATPPSVSKPASKNITGKQNRSLGR